MVRSMTGFGRAEASGESIAVTVEARSVNHRHLDVALRLPRAFAALELEARPLGQSRRERGRGALHRPLTPPRGGAAPRAQADAAPPRGRPARARARGRGPRREERLRERLRVLLAETAIDEARIVTEAAIWADKSDVTEELARLRAHLAEFTLLLDKGGPVGRPLDFLIQELNREVNTVASKADDLEMSQAALAAKGVLEKIREQVQNLE